MWEFLPFSKVFPKTLKPYINDPGFPNLRVLPYIKGRLIFSEVAARAIESGAFDLVLVDLPRYMQKDKFLDIPLRFFPMASSLIIKRDKSNFVLFPLVPNDAACLAAYMGRKRFEGFFECVDDNLMNYPEGYLFQPEMLLRDDYFIFSEGLEGYFNPLWESMNSLWRVTSYVQKLYTLYRASRVVGRLKESLAQGGKILFVCEYQLWWAIKKFFEEGPEKFNSSSPVLKEEVWNAACVLEDPYQLWVRGFLDDYPCINLRFFRMLHEGEARSFDKLISLNEILFSMTLPEKHKETGNPPISSIENFTRYLRARLLSHGQVVPRPTPHLLDSARACLGKEFARELARELLSYPSPSRPEDVAEAFFKIGSEIISLEGEGFDLPDVFHLAPYWGSQSIFHGPSSPGSEEEERKFWVDQVNPYLTRQEMRQLEKKSGGVRWAVEADYRLHEVACTRIKNVVGKEGNKIRVQRSRGTLGDGIHWKATIAATARGEKAIYIKRRINRKMDAGRLNEYTPMVFLFSEDIDSWRTSTVHDSNITLRHIELGDGDFLFEKHPPPDMVYSVFLTARKLENLWGYHVQRETLTSLALLFTRCSVMGVQRYEAINKRPKRLQCREEPLSDKDLREISPSELGVAWAVKYAEEVVLVAAYPGWKASEKLMNFARERRVEIIAVPLSTLPQDLIKRLRHIYFISTPLKRHPDRDRIVKRFLH